MPTALPTAPGYSSVDWIPMNVIGRSRSPFTFAEKLFVWPAEGWEIVVSLPRIKSREVAYAWEAAFLALNGAENTFYFSDPLNTRALGVGTGTPLVNGADQTGSALITDGWTANTIDILKAGDWLSIDDKLYRTTASVDSDATGAATLSLWPKIRTAPADNAAISLGADARGTFRLLELPATGYDTSNMLKAGTTFTARTVSY